MKVNGKDDIPYIMEHNPNVWNQQPDQVPGGTSVFYARATSTQNHCRPGFSQFLKPAI